jgi:rhodanese-related sulfurtransferase
MVGQTFTQISVQDLAQRLYSGDATCGRSEGHTFDELPMQLQLIDVREPQEIALAYIQGFVNLPLSEFALWSEQITLRFHPQVETLVLCHHGVRSAQMCQWLVAQGFTNVKNISGGIAAYSMIVDPSIPQY